MNIRHAFPTKSKPRTGRNSDPDPDADLWETLDGRRIRPKQIDPLTQRPVAVIYRHELRDDNADSGD